MRLSGSNRLLAIIVGVIVVVAVVGIAAAALTSGREAALLPEDTPEGVVQRYLRAVQDGQYRQAYDYLAPGVQADCTYDGFLNGVSGNRVERIQASLAGTRTIDDRREVTVSLTTYYAPGPNLDPFSSGGNTFQQVFQLRQVDGAWRFSQMPWPAYCAKPVAPARGGAQ